MHTVLFARRSDAQLHQAAAVREPHRKTRAVECQQRKCIREISEAAQTSKRFVIARVRRRRQHHDEARAPRQRRGGRRAIRSAGERMCLVEHDNVPGKRFERAHHLRPLDVIDRGDGDRLNRPGIDAGYELRRGARQALGVEHFRAHVEARAKLAAPLLAQARRRDDENARIGRAGDRLRDDQACLDGFSEADFVCDQHTTGIAARDRDGGLELEWQDGEVRSRGGAQRGPGRKRIREQRACGALPPGERHDARRGRTQRDPIDPLERQDEPRPGALIGGVAAVDIDDRDVVERRVRGDAPLLAADPDAATCAKRYVRHRRGAGARDVPGRNRPKTRGSAC